MMMIDFRQQYFYNILLFHFHLYFRANFPFLLSVKLKGK